MLKGTLQLFCSVLSIGHGHFLVWVCHWNLKEKRKIERERERERGREREREGERERG